VPQHIDNRRKAWVAGLPWNADKTMVREILRHYGHEPSEVAHVCRADVPWKASPQGSNRLLQPWNLWKRSAPLSLAASSRIQRPRDEKESAKNLAHSTKASWKRLHPSRSPCDIPNAGA
jgi:hypothetical protein